MGYRVGSIIRKSLVAPKPNYQFEKRQREMEKKKKKAEKAQKKTTGGEHEQQAPEQAAQPEQGAVNAGTP